MRIELEETNRETEQGVKSSGWSKEFPKVEGFYWARRSQTDRPEPKVIEVWCDAGEWFAYRVGDARDIEAAKFTQSLYEFLGPVSPSDTEELFKLREAAVSLAIPYEALLLDSASRKWIAPEVWAAIETAVAQLRKALGKE